VTRLTRDRGWAGAVHPSGRCAGRVRTSGVPA